MIEIGPNLASVIAVCIPAIFFTVIFYFMTKL